MKNLFLIILCVPILVYGQKKNKNVYMDENFDEKFVSLSYYGELIYHPGFKYQIDNPIKSRVKERTKKKFFKPSETYIKTKRRTVYNSLAFVQYNHFGHSHSFQLQSQRTWRMTKSYGYFWAYSAGIGAQIAFNSNPTYKVNDNNELRRVYLANNRYITIPVNLEYGYDFSKKTKWDAQVFTRLGGNILLNYNSFIYPQISLEFGTKIPLSK